MTLPATKDSSVRAIVITTLLIGFALRAEQFLFNRSLWLDEVFLAGNIVGRSFLGLTAPLDHYQGAPLGFLFIEKLLTTTLGGKDYVLRIFPFLAGIASLYLFYRLVRASLNGIGQIVAAGLFSASTYLVYYASEAKQYSIDVAACLLVLVCSMRCLEPDADKKDLVALGIAGVTMTWLSHPALFVCCGSVLALLLCKRGGISLTLRLLVAWSINFLILYLVEFRELSSNSVLTSYWQSFFMPMPPWKDPKWFLDTSVLIFRRPVDLPLPVIAPLVVMAGLVLCLLKKRPLFVMMSTTLAATLAASALGKYPFGDRLLLFAVPIVLICIGSAVEWLASIGPQQAKTRQLLGVVVAVTVLGGPVAQAAQHARHPFNKEDIKSVLKYIQQKKGTNDSLFVYNTSVPVLEFYAPQYGLEKMPTVKDEGHRGTPQEYSSELSRLKGQRVWLVFTHDYNWNGYDEVAYIEDLLPRFGDKLDEVRSDDAVGLLYQMR